jgi:hypothetical protein
MTRRGRVGIACAACVSIAPCSTPALARSRTVPTATAAAKVARIIRRDARLQGRHLRHAVTVTKRCCGLHVLRVHFHARLTGNRTDAYVLRVETRAGILQGVALFEHTSEERPEPEGSVLRTTSDYAFAIRHDRSGGWSFTASSGSTSSTTGGKGPKSGLGFSQTCRSPGRMPLVLYERALRSLGRAKRHFPAAFAGLAVSACEPASASR